MNCFNSGPNLHAGSVVDGTMVIVLVGESVIEYPSKSYNCTSRFLKIIIFLLLHYKKVFSFSFKERFSLKASIKSILLMCVWVSVSVAVSELLPQNEPKRHFY